MGEADTMKIIDPNPGLSVTCRGCNSIYLVEKGDVREVRPLDNMGFFQRLFRMFDPTYIGTLAVWNCPVCGYEESRRLLDLPSTWLELRISKENQ